MSNIKEIQTQLGIPVTGILDDFTQAAWRNHCLKNNLSYEPLVDSEPEIKFDETSGFVSTDLSEQPKIKQRHLKGSGNYFKGPTKKNCVFLHFTAGWDNPYNTITDWQNDKRGAVATQFVIGGLNAQTLADQYDGEIVECLPDYGSWGWHLTIGNNTTARNSIGIEICNVGPLKRSTNDYLMWAGRKVHPSTVVDLKREWRGYRYFQNITNDQLTSLSFLLAKISKDTGIDLRKGLKERLNKMDKFKAFDFDPNIRDNNPEGLYVHTNVSGPNKWGGYEKWDWAPLDGLLDLINSIK